MNVTKTCYLCKKEQPETEFGTVDVATILGYTVGLPLPCRTCQAGLKSLAAAGSFLSQFRPNHPGETPPDPEPGRTPPRR